MLYLIPTPIGNLEDITLRSLRLLKEVDAVLCEDSRITGKLLHHYQIDKPLWLYHQHNEHQKTEHIVSEILAGKKLALVSDAGTPGISDAAFLLVRKCIENNIKVECLPGATAIIPAVVQSGMPCERFCYEGFLPQKKGRQTRIKNLINETRTIVILESPHRLVKCLEELAEHLGVERKVCVCRELTKMFEENKRGTLAEVTAHFKQKEVKGEIVIVVEGNSNQ
ncbi:MAG: rRNA ((1402)-2-O)-methyltransferase [Bacteroidota bacterium]|jgi:16S rRNA (cytidine1402-2'-O)-methyltransferase